MPMFGGVAAALFLRFEDPRRGCRSHNLNLTDLIIRTRPQKDFKPGGKFVAKVLGLEIESPTVLFDARPGDQLVLTVCGQEPPELMDLGFDRVFGLIKPTTKRERGLGFNLEALRLLLQEQQIVLAENHFSIFTTGDPELCVHGAANVFVLRKIPGQDKFRVFDLYGPVLGKPYNLFNGGELKLPVLERVYQPEQVKAKTTDEEESYSIRRLFIPALHFEMEHIAPEGHGASLGLQPDDIILIPLGKTRQGEFIWAKMVVNPLVREAALPAIAPPPSPPPAQLPPAGKSGYLALPEEPNIDDEPEEAINFAELQQAWVEKGGPNWNQVPAEYRPALADAINVNLLALTDIGQGPIELLNRQYNLKERAAEQWLKLYARVE